MCNFFILDTKEPVAKSAAKHKIFREKLVGAQAKNATWPHHPLSFPLSPSSPQEVASSSSAAFLLGSVESILFGSSLGKVRDSGLALNPS